MTALIVVFTYVVSIALLAIGTYLFFKDNDWAWVSGFLGIGLLILAITRVSSNRVSGNISYVALGLISIGVLYAICLIIPQKKSTH